MENKRLGKKAFSVLLKFMVLALVVPLLWGCAKTVQEKKKLIVQQPQYPVEVQLEQLKPGLSVLYFYDLYRHINQMPQGEKIAKKGKPGPPVLQLNHRFKKGKVFDSGENRGVGMVMSGFFHLEQPGQYAFQARSNDGFELYINDNLLISDPDVHGDKLSDIGQLTAAKGGWFPVVIKYYQRKGTATIELYWQPPGAASFVIVPSQVYAHQPKP